MKWAMRWRATRASTTSASPAARGVGTLIQQVAAERHCPVTLELGGKSPQIVFADADLDAAIPAIVNAIVQNAGQTCCGRLAPAGGPGDLRAAAGAPGRGV